MRLLMLISVSLCLFFIGFVNMGTILASPNIKLDLNLSSSQMQWIMTLRYIALSSFVVFMGRISDSIGRANVYILGVFILVIGAILLSIGTDYWLIIIGSILLGLRCCWGCSLRFGSSKDYISSGKNHIGFNYCNDFCVNWSIIGVIIWRVVFIIC